MKPEKITQLYRSPNGDTWFLVRDPATDVAFVRHRANIASGGQVTDILIDAFLSGPRNPEHEALLRLLGGSLPETHEADTAIEQVTELAGREWSDAEVCELEDLLLCDIPIPEIVRLLGREHDDVRNQVAAVGRACR
jgi:hypothetical protein